MKELDYWYDIREKLQKVGSCLNDEQENMLAECEKRYIEDSVLPPVKSQIEPLIKALKSGEVIVLDYKPGSGFDFWMLKDRQWLEDLKEDMDHLEPKMQDPGVVSEPPMSPTSQEEPDIYGPATKILRVTFPDGTVIRDNIAKKTLAEVVRKIGVERVAKVVEDLGLKCCRHPIVSKLRCERYWYKGSQMALDDGWLLMTNSSTKSKREFLEKVSRALGLGLKVEEVRRRAR